MSKPTKSSIFTIPDLNAYRQRVARAANRMNRIGWGSQRQCSSDLEYPPIAISMVLKGRTINIELLEDIEGWLEDGYILLYPQKQDESESQIR